MKPAEVRQARTSAFPFLATPVKSNRLTILAYLKKIGSEGATSNEISQALGLPLNTVTARCTGLVRDRLIKNKLDTDGSCVRRLTANSHSARVLILASTPHPLTKTKEQISPNQRRERLQKLLRNGKKPGALVGLTREEVDPNFTGTSREWMDTYGHVQIMTKTALETDRQQAALMTWLGALNGLRAPLQNYLKRGAPEAFELSAFENWMRKSERRPARMKELFSLIALTRESIERLLPVLDKLNAENLVKGDEKNTSSDASGIDPSGGSETDGRVPDPTIPGLGHPVQVI